MEEHHAQEGKTDLQRAKVFTKIGKEIAMAVATAVRIRFPTASYAT